jgi:hypothetical protein
LEVINHSLAERGRFVWTKYPCGASMLKDDQRMEEWRAEIFSQRRKTGIQGEGQI